MEAFQSMTDKPLRKCPKCGKLKLQRLIGAGAGIIFKGSGFYETDYKRKSPPAGESAASLALVVEGFPKIERWCEYDAEARQEVTQWLKTNAATAKPGYDPRHILRQHNALTYW